MRHLPISLIICFLAAFTCSAQEKWYKDGIGFNSVFQNIEKGEYAGEVTGAVLLESKEGTKVFCSLASDKTTLSIIPDQNNIYDVSFKRYLFGNNEIKFKYTTYNRANAFTVLMGDSEFTTTLIDGACEFVFTGLEYKYIYDGESELLLLLFNDDVGLSPGSCNGEMQLFIKKGSTIAISIEK
ncbi:MAG: hypothetical protein ACQESQ_06725 [Bacteroidota bacterium]